MNKKLLLIDDEEIERTALRQILNSEADLEITEVADGQKALDLLCDGARPHLCLIDLRMPVMGGLEFLQRVRRDPALRGVKAMVTSASRDREMIVELAKLRIEGYLLKPYDATRTLGVLRPVLAGISDDDRAPDSSRNLLARTVLIVDDDAVARAALRDAIAKEDHWEIVEATDGIDALDQLHDGLQPDMIFMDLQMPRMDGLSLLTEIRADPDLRKLRIAVTSSLQDREKIRSLAQLQVTAYLLKPLDAGKVRAALKAAAAAVA